MGAFTTETRYFRFPSGWMRVEACESGALDDLCRVYRHCGRMQGPATVALIVRYETGIITVAETNGTVKRYQTASGVSPLLPTLEREINARLAHVLSKHLLLHAAAVAIDNHAVVLPGRSGSGKTTLAGGMVQQGGRYLTDELAILDRRRDSVLPFPKALALKAGSFGLFGAFGPDPTGPEHDRVWYLDPQHLRRGSIIMTPTPVGSVILPQFERGAPMRVQRLTMGETVLGLFENTVNMARHKEAGLDRLISIAKKAPGYRLVFGDLEEACKAVLDIVGGDGRSCT